MLKFNISHSHEMALMAFTLDREVGVDVEYLDRRAASDDCPALFLTGGS